MKHNVVTLETAKKLKAAGFRGVSMWHYSEGMNPSDELFFSQFSDLTQFDIAAPTAQEIADQLPKKIDDYCLFLEYGDDGACPRHKRHSGRRETCRDVQRAGQRVKRI